MKLRGKISVLNKKGVVKVYFKLWNIFSCLMF